MGIVEETKRYVECDAFECDFKNRVEIMGDEPGDVDAAVMKLGGTVTIAGDGNPTLLYVCRRHMRGSVPYIKWALSDHSVRPYDTWHDARLAGSEGSDG